ncbi:MAG: efflux transporter outer membrane subunit [Alistipes sp.]|nr:efflux transporter outer membrane subunit [Alistipes sp.]MBO7307300.1 efflux transporter outer membrane subunit [Alistipes sp.]
MRKVVFVALMAVVMFSSCSIHKSVVQPQLNLPKQLVDDVEQDSLCVADLSWMELFDDPILIDLIDRTLQHNRDMMVASVRIVEYEKRYRVARSDFFPNVSADAYVDRETNDGFGDNATVSPENAAKLIFGWEVDLFGRLRWANRQAKANYLKTIEARRALQMTLIADVATAYFELVALDTELQIVTNTLDTRRENVRQAKLRFEGGLTSEIPYQQAQVELARTASLVPDLKLKIKMKENEISYLAGGYPAAVKRKSSHLSFKNNNILKVGLPSDLVERRPDVREAELAFKAAMASAGVQWANRFPHFVLEFEFGLEHEAFAGFFTAPLTYLLAELTSPVFAFGKRKAQYEAALAACEAKCYEYEEKVLLAFREVSNAMAAYRSAVENTRLMDDLMKSSQKYVSLAMVQHMNGHVNYLAVLDAQRSYFNAEIERSNAIRDQYLALIELYKALGGGWK